MNWANTVIDSWEAVRLLCAKHHVFLEIPWTSSMYLRYLVPSWRKVTTPKRAKYVKLPWIPLALHVLIGTVELFRYYHHHLAVTGEPPEPNVTDLALGLVMAAGSFHPAAYVHEGNIPFVRTTVPGDGGAAGARLHAGGTCMVTRSGTGRPSSSWTTSPGSGGYGRAEGTSRASGRTGTPSRRPWPRYHPLALWEGDYPAGIPVFGAIVFAVLAVDKWASRKMDGK
ncbi:hypothetical protein CSHISOI_06413 [Colletotrichum shisoi]|uniref:Uncharacterized protein n=1 Tax=Colletotrichum shisoi TaxID=2078593 RepID=A0A5Q4BPY2_9PEZI|nr:hypothetical protein CSHISOI_06413 [Colletotrichum shisoi]